MAKPFETHQQQHMFENPQQIQAQIIRGLRYFIVLHLLKIRPMHGYRVITVIRKNFGIYLGPSSVYPLLRELEDMQYLESTWETESLHPKRIYNITSQGQNILNYIEQSVGHILAGVRIPGTNKSLGDD